MNDLIKTQIVLSGVIYNYNISNSDLVKLISSLKQVMSTGFNECGDRNNATAGVSYSQRFVSIHHMPNDNKSDNKFVIINVDNIDTISILHKDIEQLSATNIEL